MSDKSDSCDAPIFLLQLYFFTILFPFPVGMVDGFRKTLQADCSKKQCQKKIEAPSNS